MIGWMWTSSPCSPSAHPHPAWCVPRLRVPLYSPSSSFLPFFASQASMGRPYFCWILSLYHSGMTLKLQKGMMRRSGVR